MAEKKLQFPPDPIFNDILYTILFNATSAEKRLLKGKYLKAAMAEKSARSFIQNASLEEKYYMLSQLGYRHFIVMAKEDLKLEGLRDILDEFEKDNKAKAFKQIVSNGFYVSSDKEFNRLLGFVSRSIHHHNFYLDLELLRVGFQIRKWRKRAFTPRDLEFREADEAATQIAKTILSSALSMDYAKGTLGVSGSELKILLYLYMQPHALVSESHLTEFFHGYMRAAELRKSIRSLHKGGYADGERKDEWSYTISGKGTKLVGEYFKVVFTKLNQ